MADMVIDIYKQLEGEKFGGYVQFMTRVFAIRDPELINQVLIKDFTYFEDRGPPVEKSVELFSSSLNNLCGDEWRIARQKLTPTFSSGKLKMMFEPIKECCSEAVLYLKDNKNDLEAKGFILRLIIKIIANAAFGLKVDVLHEEGAKTNKFFNASSKFFKPSVSLLFKFLIFVSFPKLRNLFKVKLMDDDVDQFFRNLVKDITKHRQETGTRRNDFLQIMLDQKKKEQTNLNNGITNVSFNDDEAEEPEDKELLEQLKYVDNISNNCSIPNEIFTEDFIASQTFIFISGGSETTATVLSFVLYELAMNPELQVQVQQEISNVLSSHEFNYEGVKKMKYLEQFIYETLRLHPILGALLRYCKKDYKIPGTDVVIEKGTMLNIPVLGLHKDPQYFPNPEKFNPDHFQNMEVIPKNVYMPFGYGPRICIAMRLAMLEMKIILVSLLSHYTIELSEKTKLPLKMFKISVFPGVDGGIWVKFKDRQFMEIFYNTMEISWLITAVLAILVIYCMYRLKDMHTSYWKKRGVPVISTANPVTGFITSLLFSRKTWTEMMNDMYKNLEGEKFGGYFQLFTPTLLVRDTELINQILIKDFTHFEDHGPPQEKHLDLFGLNLSNLCGDEWRAARHKLTPTFTSGKLKMMFEPIKKCSEEGVLFLRNKTGQDIEARGFVGKVIIKIIASVAFGIDVDTFNEKEAAQNKFIKATTDFFKPSLSLMVKFLISNLLPKLRKVLKFKLVDDDINNFFKKLTKDIIKHREDSGTRRNDFLQLMLDEKKKEQGLLFPENNTTFCNEYEKEDKELLDQLTNIPTSSNSLSGPHEIFTEEFIASLTFSFISAGSEATAGILSFVLYELAVNQDVQKRVKKEVADILSTHEFNYQVIKKMAYLEQAIYETLRLHTVASALTRYCTKDYKIPGTDLIIEKGSSVVVPAGCLQKDPQYFPDPEKFNPDRFEDMDAIPKGVFFPFGSGPRICIAMRLAMLEMKIILALLLLNYTVTLSKKTKLPLKIMKNSILNNVDGGVWIKFEEDK
ncbi:uncharacterized protein LOC142320079 [Lycorma delicatula]|uniref:uncharacterized protein LOC142320079 n=1 Tax=Lycorma delicatula TaxID=130591 RepID=UPI003F50E76A